MRKSKRLVGKEIRPRNASATRADLLQAARRLFSRHGYDMVGLRQIAAEVGVNQALAARYFGSKRGLFAAAIKGLFPPDRWFVGDRATAGLRMAAEIYSDSFSIEGVDPLTLLIRSAGHPDAAGLLREGLDSQAMAPITEWLGGARAPERAIVLVGLFIGTELLRKVIKSRSLAEPDLDAIIVTLGHAMQHVVDDDAEIPAWINPDGDDPDLSRTVFGAEPVSQDEGG